MAISIPSLISSFAMDMVAIFDQNFIQLFRDARTIKAVVKETAKVMEHPIESGAIITDHRIILPVEIDLSLILLPATYQEVYKQIQQFYLDSTLLVIQTRSGIYTNQLIQAMPHEEDPTIFDTITIALSLKEVLIVTAQYTSTPRNAKNSNTVNRGTQHGTPANGDQTASAASSITGLS